MSEFREPRPSSSRKRVVLALALWWAIVSAGLCNTIDLTPDQLTPETFNPARIMMTANKLIALGHDDAYASLLQYAEQPIDIHESIERMNRDYYVAWLCLLVYDPKPESGLPTPAFGVGDFPDTGEFEGTNSAAWPRYPLALSRDVPFLLVTGYAVGGATEKGNSFIKRCQASGVFRTTPYPITNRLDAEIALTDLTSSDSWIRTKLSWDHSAKKRLDWPETRTTKFLRSQVENIPYDFQYKTLDLTPDELTWKTYNPAKILATANKLIALGPQDAYLSLLKYVERPPGVILNDALLKRDNYLAWLCLLVYDPKPGTGLPVPMFGMPDFPNTGGYSDRGSMNTAAWPRFPLAMSRDVPFLLVSGYAIAGFPEPGPDYLKRCHDHGDFHATAYPIPTYAQASEALDTLISSSLWTGLNWKDAQGAIDPDFLNHEVTCLNEQIDRMNPSFLERRFVGIHPSFFKAHESEIVVIGLLIVLFCGFGLGRRRYSRINNGNKAAILAGAVLLGGLVPAHAADVHPLNARQMKIVDTLIYPAGQKEHIED